MKDKAIEKIRQTPKIVDELRFGGFLMYDKKTGNIFHCDDSDKTYYQRWNDITYRFDLFEWQMGGLDRFDLDIITKQEYS